MNELRLGAVAGLAFTAGFVLGAIWIDRLQDTTTPPPPSRQCGPSATHRSNA